MKLSDYHYELPASRIAVHPLAVRDQAKLLCYRGGSISHHVFTEAPALLPDNALVVFNNTKVIPARLFLYRETGARIELLLLHPIAPAEVHTSMQSSGPVQWECMIGNKKKWRDDEVIGNGRKEKGEFSIEAKLLDREKQIVEISWDGDASFAEMVEMAGKLPLPPYLNREAEEDDFERYQTVYAAAKGAVAAPTAGLHFTDRVLEAMRKRGIGLEHVTLHVGAGTFQPVKTDDPRAHDMHVEQIHLGRANVQRLLDHEGPVIATGTTSMRVLESMYWFGLEAAHNPGLPADHVFFLDQNKAYLIPDNQLIDTKKSLKALLDHFDRHGLKSLTAETGIYVLPGYRFRMVDAMFTNFHLPGTTLILLVAAFIGEDWRRVYDAAMEQDYRFLSYGDSSLLFKLK
ncbi:MAG: S-adenosylmethionine:tRNA ribosyltransferase-isomerase [Bacteroidia bacterium]